MFSIATWNVNSIKVRLLHVLQWLEANPVDVLALQETKSIDENFPKKEIEEAGYQVTFTGQPTYNGVAIISKKAASDVVTAVPNFQDEQKRFLAATINGVRVINLYVPNGQSVDSEKYIYKLNWLDKVGEYLQEQLAQYEKVVVLGDFNIAPEDRDVHDPVAWEGHVLVSAKERAVLQRFLDAGYTDVFRQFEQAEKSYSWWDYRNLAFRRNKGLRIDLILASNGFAAQCSESHIDKAPRKLERPSDHTPVVASFE